MCTLVSIKSIMANPTSVPQVVNRDPKGKPAKCTCSSPSIPVSHLHNLFPSCEPFLFPVDHYLQATVSIMSISFNPPILSLSPPLLSCPPLLTVCRIGEAYRLATTIKVQQVGGGSSHHRSKLHKPSCDRQL